MGHLPVSSGGPEKQYFGGVGGCVGQQEEMPQMDLSPVGLAVGLAEIPKPKEY